METVKREHSWRCQFMVKTGSVAIVQSRPSALKDVSSSDSWLLVMGTKIIERTLVQRALTNRSESETATKCLTLLSYGIAYQYCHRSKPLKKLKLCYYFDRKGQAGCLAKADCSRHFRWKLFLHRPADTTRPTNPGRYGKFLGAIASWTSQPVKSDFYSWLAWPGLANKKKKTVNDQRIGTSWAAWIFLYLITQDDRIWLELFLLFNTKFHCCFIEIQSCCCL